MINIFFPKRRGQAVKSLLFGRLIKTRNGHIHYEYCFSQMSDTEPAGKPGRRKKETIECEVHVLTSDKGRRSRGRGKKGKEDVDVIVQVTRRSGEVGQSPCRVMRYPGIPAEAARQECKPAVVEEESIRDAFWRITNRRMQRRRDVMIGRNELNRCKNPNGLFEESKEEEKIEGIGSCQCEERCQWSFNNKGLHMKNTWQLKEGVLLFMELESLIKHNEVAEVAKNWYNKVTGEVIGRVPAMMEEAREIIELGKQAHLLPEEQGEDSEPGPRMSEDSGIEEDAQRIQKRPVDEEEVDPFEEASDSGYEENTAMRV